VTTVAQRSYRAFLSYSHNDKSAADWLHTSLERYRVAPDLAGRETARGKVPRELRPIFRDRVEFAAGQALGEQTLEALAASDALIVLCSPAAVRSHYVNEEVRVFKARFPERPTIPVIIEAPPGDVVAAAFPPALRFKVTRDGAVTAEADELLAADARGEADGRDLALAKVVSTILGVPLDDVRKRDAIEHRRRVSVRAATLAVVGALSLVAAFLYTWHLDNRNRDVRIDQRLDRVFSLITPALAGPDAEAGLRAALAGCEEQRDPRLCSARKLLADGKREDAEAVFLAVAEEKERAAQRNAKDAALAYRNFGAVAGLGNPKKARDAYARAAALDPGDREALYWRGWLDLEAGDMTAAEQALVQLKELSAAAMDEEGLFRAELRLSDLALARKNIGAAEAGARRALAIAQSELAKSSGRVEWQRNAAIAIERMGDILARTGDLAAAGKSYDASLAATRRLAAAEPGNALRQRDVSVAENRQGDLLMRQGRASDACAAYWRGLSIVEALSKAEAGNAGWQRDVSISLERLGDCHAASSDNAAALAFYQRAHAIRRQLAAGDPASLGLQRDLAVTAERIGSVLTVAGQPAAALPLLQETLSVRSRLSLADPANRAWRRDLAVSHEKMGDAAGVLREPAKALRHFEESLALREELLKTDPSSTDVEFELAISYYKLGLAHADLGDQARSTASLGRAQAIVKQLVERSSGNQDWAEALKTIEDRLAASR
jgi:tetratricopeptide (TPR) repeat protein